MTERHFLGRVKRAPTRSEAYHYATVELLVESDDSGTHWIGPVRDALTRFPKRGCVHWHDAPSVAHLGSMWQFAIDEHSDVQRADRPEQFQLENGSAQEPIEVLDLRGWSDEITLRSAFAGEGVPLAPTPVARRVLVWLPSGLCIGPVLLRQGSAPGLWALEGPEAHRDASRMPAFRLAPAEINHVQLDGARWFVSPRLDLGQNAGIQNWASDFQLARSILDRLRKMDPDVVKALGLTERVYREYLEHVEMGRMGNVDPAVERARAERLRGLRNAIQSDTDLLTEASNALLNIEPVRAEVDRLVQAKVLEVVETKRVEIDAALQGANKKLSQASDQLARVEQQVERSRAEITALDAALLEKREELEKKVASFDEELTTRLETLARRPEAAFAEAAIMRAVLGSTLGNVLGNGGTGARPRAGGLPIRLPQFDSAATELTDQVAIRRCLGQCATANALSLHAIVCLHAAFVSGVVPVVMGSRGYDLLRAYASAVAGARLHWVPIASSTTDPQDLLGRFDSSVGRIVPAAAGLLDVVRDATQSGRLHIVVFEGFNRAPTEAYLSPILEVARSSRVGDANRVIPLASPGLLADEDPYCGLARLSWPPNVLVACLPSDGTIALPVPPSVWRFLAILDADDSAHPTAHGSLARSVDPLNQEVAPKLWRELVASALIYAPDSSHSAFALARAMSLHVADAIDAARLEELLRLNGMPPADASSLAFGAILVTRSSQDAKAIEDAVSVSNIVIENWRIIQAEAERLRS